MLHKSLRVVIVGALMTVGCLGSAYAAPIAPAAITTLSSPSVKLASFWGRPFPWGYRFYRGQCYSYVPSESGYGWRRVWVCTERRRLEFGHGYGGRF
jgi:hypothetical protein